MATLNEVQRDYVLAEVEHNRLNKIYTDTLKSEPWELNKLQALRTKRAIAKMACDDLHRKLEAFQTTLNL